MFWVTVGAPAVASRSAALPRTGSDSRAQARTIARVPVLGRLRGWMLVAMRRILHQEMALPPSRRADYPCGTTISRISCPIG